MSKQHRIPKPLGRNLAEIEDHLYLVRVHLRGLATDLAHIKALATELRALVCLSSGTEGLLWRLIDNLGVSDEVTLHLAGSVNPDHPLARSLKFAVAFIQRPGPHSDPKLPPAHVYSLRDVIKGAEAVWVLGMKGYTHESLIKVIAQQAGSAHEAEGVEPGLSALEDILINGIHPYVPILVTDAELTLEVGERVLEAAEKAGKYRRRRFSKPLTLSVHVRLRELPAGTVPLALFEAPISGLRVAVRMRPTSVGFLLTKRDQASVELSTPLPPNWRAGEDAVFAVTYEHEARRIQAMSPGRPGDVLAPCDLGFVEGDLRLLDLPNEAGPFIERRAVYIHEVLMSPADLIELPNILIEGPKLIEGSAN